MSLHSLYNNIKPPSWLPAGTDFHLFKAGIEPKWEDPQCEHGGKWTILVPKGAKQTIDKYWLHMVGALTCYARSCRLPRTATPFELATHGQELAHLWTHPWCRCACALF